ncbi:hypothetical protein D0T11_00885 [Hymenobacter rubripertinctus]|uniref:Outer membrane protein beta-barrel domain-containing protein n=2 Tax=Hymenobacter rubripertinctus TaxID=2029981 RepID=A0A418RAD6_9BACT|nr:hypothetical protein D0T11_00885 [Hymenobacter rubripertinctus]
MAEAEVTPRANFWDHLDHELVAQQHEQIVQQNTVYRQRAAVYRWVAAACLVLALGFGGWAFLNHSGLGSSPQLAAQLPAAAPGSGETGLRYGNPALASEGANSLGFGTAADRLSRATTQQSAYAAEAAPAAPNQSGQLRTMLAALSGAGESAGQESRSGVGRSEAYAGSFERFFTGQSGTLNNGSETAFLANFNTLVPRSSRLRGGLGLGLGRPDTLRAALPAGPSLPATALAAVAPEAEPKPAAKLWKRLRIGGSYAVGSFNPNINFSRTDARTQADPVTSALRTYYQEEAENEYRRNLRAGLSQRVALTASYALGRHWTVASGLEAAEQQATSATTYGFLDGKQVGRESAALFNRPAAFAAPSQPRTTSYRYRTAAVPLSVAYGSSNKPGLSLYAKVGAVVSVLLSSRSELEGSPEATRNYSLKSAESPYRPVFASVRGGAGIHYQPVLATWNVAVGPTAETFVTTLNANPTQRAMNQSRPYSLGLEASLEFGGTKPMPGVQ